MESAETAALMIGVCFAGSYVYRRASPLEMLPRSLAAAIMGTLVATVALLIVWSPFGRRTGAHFNPALTFTYYCLGFIHRWDAIFYILSQFIGGLAGVLFSKEVLGNLLSMPPVSYVATIPGNYGTWGAFFAVFIFAGITMGAILSASNRAGFTGVTPLLVAGLTILFYGLSPSLSGFSVNPARSFSSALFALLWDSLWVYFVGPCCGMLTAAMLYLQWPGSPPIYCAKVLHDDTSVCPFNCRFAQLIQVALDGRSAYR